MKIDLSTKNNKLNKKKILSDSFQKVINIEDNPNNNKNQDTF